MNLGCVSFWLFLSGILGEINPAFEWGGKSQIGRLCELLDGCIASLFLLELRLGSTS